MELISLQYAAFVIVSVVLYYIIPKKYRWIVLLSGSLFYYVYICKFYVGFILFIAFLVAPVFVARSDKRIVIIALLVFLLLECVVLSPILRGYFIFFVFYIMIVKYAVITNRKQEYV